MFHLATVCILHEHWLSLKMGDLMDL